jgi:hypothetical protein
MWPLTTITKVKNNLLETWHTSFFELCCFWGPAYTAHNADHCLVVEAWYQHGKLHRRATEGPARKQQGLKEWCSEGFGIAIIGFGNFPKYSLTPK